MTTDLFGPVPRAPKIVRMHATDHGQAPGLMAGWKTTNGGYFKCTSCGHDTGWLFNLTVTDVRRGLPCPVCNSSEAP